MTGLKYDDDKVLSGVLLDFSRALTEVAEVGTMGAKKYARTNWLQVENPKERYTDALMRHLLAINTEHVDKESGLKHLAHVAWNALAVLELEMRE